MGNKNEWSNWTNYTRAYWFQEPKIDNNMLLKQLLVNYRDLQLIKKELNLPYDKEALGENGEKNGK